MYPERVKQMQSWTVRPVWNNRNWMFTYVTFPWIVYKILFAMHLYWNHLPLNFDLLQQSHFLFQDALFKKNKNKKNRAQCDLEKTPEMQGGQFMTQQQHSYKTDATVFFTGLLLFSTKNAERVFSNVFVKTLINQTLNACLFSHWVKYHIWARDNVPNPPAAFLSSHI